MSKTKYRLGLANRMDVWLKENDKTEENGRYFTVKHKQKSKYFGLHFNESMEQMKTYNSVRQTYERRLNHDVLSSKQNFSKEKEERQTFFS